MFDAGLLSVSRSSFSCGRDMVACDIRQRIDIFGELGLPHEVMLTERRGAHREEGIPTSGSSGLGDPLCRLRPWHLRRPTPLAFLSGVPFGPFRKPFNAPLAGF